MAQTATNQKERTEKLISLAEQKQILSLDELSKELQIADKEKLEEFLIDSIHDGVINGKIDELNGQLLVTFHQQREFGKAQWEDLQTRMGVLLKNLDLFRTNLQMMILGEEGGGELP